MRMRIITFKIDDELLRMLDEWAWELRCSRSELIRRAIVSFLSQLCEEHPFTHYKIIVKRHRKTRAITVIA